MSILVVELMPLSQAAALFNIIRLSDWCLKQESPDSLAGQRAQAEGVPAPMIDRYLQNVSQAAETVWQLMSKVDAVGLQAVWLLPLISLALAFALVACVPTP